MVEAEQFPSIQASVRSLPIASPEFLSAANLFLAQLRTPTTDKQNLVEDVPEVSAKRKQSGEDEQDEDSGTRKKQRQSASSD